MSEFETFRGFWSQEYGEATIFGTGEGSVLPASFMPLEKVRATMAQLRFTLYIVEPGKRPKIEWLDNAPLPVSRLKANARESKGGSMSQHSPSAGVLIDVWQIHQSGCLVIAESRELVAGERFAISMEPLWKVVSSHDEQRVLCKAQR
ncbi:MAG TPA: hypothetical protein VJ372_00950 [Pyrinomonadaceae bacterium]|jgi:hypothetical protein|nr:hypothetical protein [Pyrinomonadaceae bacterium]